jgi:hypothetical protein
LLCWVFHLLSSFATQMKCLGTQISNAIVNISLALTSAQLPYRAAR